MWNIEYKLQKIIGCKLYKLPPASCLLSYGRPVVRTTFPPISSQASIPPSSAPGLLYPARANKSAARALECSAGQVQ
jgi:hypothetical protein